LAKKQVVTGWLLFLLLIGVASAWAMDIMGMEQEELLPKEAQKVYDEGLQELQEKDKTAREWVNRIKSKFFFELRYLDIEYTESSARLDLDADWAANTVRGDIGLEAYYQGQGNDTYGVEAGYGMLLPVKEDENWSYNDLTQENDMKLKLQEWRMGLNWHHWFNPDLGLGQSIFYARRQFKQTGNDAGPVTDSLTGSLITSNDSTSVEQDINVDYIAYKPKIIWNLGKKVELQLGVTGGYVVFAEVSNKGAELSDLSDKPIKGYLLGAEGRISYKILEKMSIYLGGFWEKQRLDGFYEAELQGGVIQHAEVRESVFETKGVLSGLEFKF